MLAEAEKVAPVERTLTALPPTEDASAPALPHTESLDRQRLIEREEHAANVLRLRNATTIGAAIWPVFFIVDWLVDRYVQPGVFAWFGPLRLLVAMVIIGVNLRLRRAPLPSARGLVVLDTATFGSASAVVSIMCVHFGGLRSPYGAGISAALFCRAAFVAMPWRIGLIPNGTSALAYLLILLGSTLFSPLTRGQLGDPAAIVLFTLSMALILSAVAFGVVGGQSVWSLRRQLFQARNIGRYRLVKCIGSGAVGEVWSAHHAALKRNVAVKVLRSHHRNDPMALLRFEREVKATSELTHPNTVRIFDYGVTSDGMWFYAMELLEGVDLGRLVKEEGPLSVPRALHIMIQASRALGEAHAHGIVHRDVKPQNLLVTSAGGEANFVKVLDFGIAKLTDQAAEGTLTQTGWIGGTPAYISPEVAAGRAADCRSDVYGIGATLYFALAGEPPFTAPNAAALLAAHVREPPVPPSAKRGAPLPPELEAIVLRTLAKDPQDRYKTAGDLADALAALGPI